MVYSECMPKRQRSRAAGLEGYVLTVNQVVSYDLGRARRSRGWTQEETAARLEAVSGKKWTAASLSASERAVATSRPRIFDANELVTFSRVFEYPVGYFLLPIEPKQGEEERKFYYLLTRLGEEDGHQSEPIMEMDDLLYSVIPLRYPAAVIDTVNRLLASKGIVWQPHSEVTWDDGGEDDYYAWRGLNDSGEAPEVSLDEWETIVNFAALMKKLPAARVLRLMADAMEANLPAKTSDSQAEPPF